MKITDLKIGTRLGILAGFLTLAMLAVGLEGWYTLSESTQRNAEMMHKAALLEQSIDTARSAQVEFKKQVQEWKDTLLRGNDQAMYDKYTKAFADRSAQTTVYLQKLKDLFTQLKFDTVAVDEALKAHDELGGKYAEALKQYDVAKAESAHIVDGLVKGMDRPPTQKIDGIVAFVLDQSNHMMANAEQQAEASYKTACLFLLGAVVLAAALGGAVTLWLCKSITIPLQKALKLAQTVASGDLGSKIEASGKDETGQLLYALGDMNSSLTRIVGDVRRSTNTISEAAREIARGNLDLSARTEDQASSLEETASAMEQLTSTVKQNADNARQANGLAATASEVARKGGNVVSQVVETMGSINDSSKKIVDIISVIDGIAFQTNILALNAAVEAARAGEQGRGFAVVAAEVRNLAQRSAAAAKEIKALIGDSVEKVDVGAKLVDQAGATMEEIVTSVKRVTDIIAEISTASDEQTNGIEQINVAIMQMDQVTQRNAALVEEAAAAADAMQHEGASLVEVVSIFKLDDACAPSQPAKISKPVKAVAAPKAKTAPAAPAMANVQKPALASANAQKSLAGAATGDDWEEF
ncbi:MAG TPA: methyl-accepting chemotaxis protein [Burkholderiaceae bacterium]